jgi:hypothetical protein
VAKGALGQVDVQKDAKSDLWMADCRPMMQESPLEVTGEARREAKDATGEGVALGHVSGPTHAHPQTSSELHKALDSCN